jgi:dihydrofolate reductase
MNMELIIIAAVSSNNVIGNNGKIPWHIKEDLKRFKEMTMGYPIIMGRKTCESIISRIKKPLPGRINIILSRTGNYLPEGLHVYPSLDLGLQKAEEYGRRAFVIGGEQVYKDTIDLSSRLEITEVHQEVQGDAFFPSINKEAWKETMRRNRGEYSFVRYLRK